MKFTTASEVDLGHEKVGKLLFMLAVPAILMHSFYFFIHFIHCINHTLNIFCGNIFE